PDFQDHSLFVPNIDHAYTFATLSLHDALPIFKAMLEYNADLFESATARRMLTGFQTLLAGLVAKPQTPVSDLPLLTETDQHQLIDRKSTRLNSSHQIISYAVF